SHDLRTPLTHLRGAAEMALSGPPDLDRYREALADCVEESDRVLVMLNALMDISEAESGTMLLQRESLSLEEIVRPAADAPGGGVLVFADRTRLQQAAANLIDNAVKYTPAGGRVDVEVFRDGGD